MSELFITLATPILRKLTVESVNYGVAFRTFWNPGRHQILNYDIQDCLTAGRHIFGSSRFFTAITDNRLLL
jgi:hypothetical protein